jgi:hypothetical protein
VDIKALIAILLAVPGILAAPVLAESVNTGLPAADIGPRTAAEQEAVKETTQESPQTDLVPVPRFTPSEKLRADDAISFPVDI